MASKMIKCKTCGADIASNAKACPSCGAKNKKPIFTKWWFWLLVIIVIAAIAGGSGGGEKSSETSSDQTTALAMNETTTVAETTKEASKITYENFLNIKMGSTLADVEALLGKGSELSSSEVSGIKTIIYQWNGSGLSNMNVTIQNDEVAGKAQLGLKDGNENVTLDKYNQVKEGMSFEEVTAILGEGELMSQTKILDMESIMYTWANSDGSNMNCTFTGDKMQMKAQFNLK